MMKNLPKYPFAFAKLGEYFCEGEWLSMTTNTHDGITCHIDCNSHVVNELIKLMAFGHNELIELIKAFGHNVMAFGHNELIELIMAFGHKKLVKLIMAFGHTNGLVGHKGLLNIIGIVGYISPNSIIGLINQISLIGLNKRIGLVNLNKTIMLIGLIGLICNVLVDIG
jgi:hypothetical protein